MRLPEREPPSLPIARQSARADVYVGRGSPRPRLSELQMRDAGNRGLMRLHPASMVLQLEGLIAPRYDACHSLRRPVKVAETFGEALCSTPFANAC